ncbi:MAG: Rab family GTPase [Candidatus Hodarchaeota archaeon]
MSNFSFKIVVLGDGAVGKTSLIKRYIEGVFKSDYKVTLGVDIFKKAVTMNDKTVEASFWDFSGQSIFEKTRPNFYSEASGMILAFDLARLQSLTSIPKWKEECIKYTRAEIPALLVGCKSDLVDLRTVNDPTAQSVAKQLGLEYYPTSAKTGEGIKEVAEILIKKIIEKNT